MDKSVQRVIEEKWDPFYLLCVWGRKQPLSVEADRGLFVIGTVNRDSVGNFTLHFLHFKNSTNAPCDAA